MEMNENKRLGIACAAPTLLLLGSLGLASLPAPDSKSKPQPVAVAFEKIEEQIKSSESEPVVNSTENDSNDAAQLSESENANHDKATTALKPSVADTDGTESAESELPSSDVESINEPNSVDPEAETPTDSSEAEVMIEEASPPTQSTDHAAIESPAEVNAADADDATSLDNALGSVGESGGQPLIAKFGSGELTTDTISSPAAANIPTIDSITPDPVVSSATVEESVATKFEPEPTLAPEPIIEVAAQPSPTNVAAEVSTPRDSPDTTIDEIVAPPADLATSESDPVTIKEPAPVDLGSTEPTTISAAAPVPPAIVMEPTPIIPPKSSTRESPFLGVGIRDQAATRITQLYAGSTATKLGIEIGDSITSINGVRIVDLASMRTVLSKMKTGTMTEVVVVRNGTERKLGPLPLGKR